MIGPKLGRVTGSNSKQRYLSGRFMFYRETRLSKGIIRTPIYSIQIDSRGISLGLMSLTMVRHFHNYGADISNCENRYCCQSRE